MLHLSPQFLSGQMKRLDIVSRGMGFFNCPFEETLQRLYLQLPKNQQGNVSQKVLCPLRVQDTPILLLLTQQT